MVFTVLDHAKSFLFIISLFCFLNIHLWGNGRGKYEPYIDQVISEFAKEMRDEFDLRMCGNGGVMPYDVEEIAAEFECKKHVTVEEARQIEVMATQRFLSIINSNEKLRPFLREYPFTPFRTEVSIAYTKPDGRYYENSIAYVSLLRGKIFYWVEEPITEGLTTILIESYEEAQKIVLEK